MHRLYSSAAAVRNVLLLCHVSGWKIEGDRESDVEFKGERKWSTLKKTMLLTLALVFLISAALPGLAGAEASRMVEIFFKPGMDSKQVGKLLAVPRVSFSPDASWAIDKADPFLKDRIRSMVVEAFKKQLFVPAAPETPADVRISVKVTQWGRFKNQSDQVLVQYIDMKLQLEATLPEKGSTVVFWATAKYRLENSQDTSMTLLNEAGQDLFDEIALRFVGK